MRDTVDMSVFHDTFCNRPLGGGFRPCVRCGSAPAYRVAARRSPRHVAPRPNGLLGGHGDRRRHGVLPRVAPAPEPTGCANHKRLTLECGPGCTLTPDHV